MPEAQWSARGRNMKLPSLAPAGLARVCQFFVKVSHRRLVWRMLALTSVGMSTEAHDLRPDCDGSPMA